MSPALGLLLQLSACCEGWAFQFPDVGPWGFRATSLEQNPAASAAKGHRLSSHRKGICHYDAALPRFKFVIPYSLGLLIQVICWCVKQTIRASFRVGFVRRALLRSTVFTARGVPISINIKTKAVVVIMPSPPPPPSQSPSSPRGACGDRS